MGAEQCNACGCFPGVFFYWSTSRGFPKDKLSELTTDKFQKQQIKTGTVQLKICYECAGKLGYGILKDKE